MPAEGLQAWLQRLETLHPSEIELGLDRVRSVAERLKLLKPACPVITVAGTNGKGSTVAAIEAVGATLGLRVASYTSPHLIRYNERIRLAGEPATDEAIVRAFERIDAARGDISLTYFEFGTLAALEVFRDADADVLVLEVGLGGRLDAVNIIDPDVAVITSIAIDHEAWLGSDREVIAVEKAGILRRAIPAIIADIDPPSSLLSALRTLDCRSLFVSEQDLNPYAGFVLRPENLAAGAYALAELGYTLSGDTLTAAFARLALPGRLQKASYSGQQILLDVAHNIAAVENLAKHLSDHTDQPCVAVFAALSDKDIHAMIRSCRGVFSSWHVADLPETNRAQPAEELAAALTDQGEHVSSSSGDPVRALRRAVESMQGRGTVVVFGSFFTVAAVVSELSP